MPYRRDDVTVKKCVELYKQNPNMAAIADELNCNHMTVKDRLNKAGIDTNKNTAEDIDYRENISSAPPKELPDFENREERLQYMRENQRDSLMHFVAEIAEGLNERRRDHG